MVTLQYAITKQDYANYYAYVVWDAPANRKKRLIYYAKQLVPVLIFLLAFFYTGLFDRPGKFIFLIAGVLFITTFLSLLGVRNNIMRQAERIADDPDNASIFADFTLTVTDAGITLKNDSLETKFQWTAFLKKLESKNYYFLFHNSIQAVIIPKRVFDSEEVKARFEKILTRHLSFEAEVSEFMRKK